MTTTTRGKPAPAPDFQSDINKLRNTVEFIDCLAQGGFSEISAIARLALAQLERPEGYKHPEVIAHALGAIWGKADEIMNCINNEAEQVGCNYVDESTTRRLAARNALIIKERTHAD